MSRAATAFLQGVHAQPLFSLAADLAPPARARAAGLAEVARLRRRARGLREYLQQCPNFPRARAVDEEAQLATRRDVDDADEGASGVEEQRDARGRRRRIQPDGDAAAVGRLLRLALPRGERV